MITTGNVANLPAWIDLGSPDPAATAAFYGKVFGWTAQMPENDPAEGEYLILHKDGKAVAGVGGLQDPTARSDWIVYVRVPDAEAAIKATESLGGTVRVPLMQVGPEGAMARLTDPSGAQFALWQPGVFTGVEAACEDDSLLWVQLWTRDAEAAKSFYGRLFGWQTAPFDMPEGTYDLWTTNPSEPLDAFGGMMPISSGMPVQDERWIPYFMVADADATVARAVEAGGTVEMPATDGPPGRLAALADPFGARFSLLKPAPM
jgi:hypothetical protein